MHRTARRLGMAALVGVLVTSTGGVARAELGPEASASAAATPSPSPGSEAPLSPSASSTPTPTDTASTSASASPSTTPTATPTATPTPASLPPSPVPSLLIEQPPSTPDRLVAPPSDGVVPDTGQVDEYLELSATRDRLVAEVAAATTALTGARSTIADLLAQRAYTAAVATSARVAATARQDDVEDVARDMYQQGDGGLGAIATVLGSGPDGLIDRLDNVRMVRTTARDVINDAAAARADVALAEATSLAIDMRLAAATSAQGSATTALTEAQAALAKVEARLRALAIVAPQVAIGADGCPTVDVPGTLRDGSDVVGAATLCRSAVRQAATPQAALAITWAFAHLGAPYACGGAGRLLPYRMDCSSFVSRAYYEGAGIRTAGEGWAPSTRDMVPWDGVPLDPHYAYVEPQALRAGDLVLYDTCPQGGCPYKHVVMYLGSPDGGDSYWMAHTNSCGDVAKVERFWGFPTSGHPFLVARRVLALPGEAVTVPRPLAASPEPSVAASR